MFINTTLLLSKIKIKLILKKLTGLTRKSKVNKKKDATCACVCVAVSQNVGKILI